ncbi:hypothetical protein NYE80_24040 [Paenibacillus sp. FSL H7-0357]|uniref:portal protein n=1 Tax=Paenibacillus sp. FSL H7-0357 TaxID=1536774 RepID=UPI001E65DADC|nr:hypothetical protein [Paenibacillus sp. FSL H7-0357]
MDKIKSIFGNEGTEKPEIEPINTPQQQKLVNVVQTDFSTYKENRQNIEPTWQQEQRMYRGDHWYGLRPEHITNLRPSNVDNICWAQIESIVGKITGWDPFPDFEAQEEGDEEKAQDLNDFMPYELRQIGFRSKYTRAIRTCVIHGPLILKTIYDPTVEGGRGLNRWDGQNDIIPVELGSFFPDPRIIDFINLQKAGANIVKTPQPLSYFRERWPKQGKKVQAESDSDVRIFQNEGTQESFNFTDTSGDASTQSQMAGLLEYWYRGLPKVITPEDKQLFEEQATNLVESGKDPSEALAKADGTMEGIHCIYVSAGGVFLEHKAYVYDHGKYPFSARTLFPIEGSVWGKGFMRDMIKPQIMLNKFAELAVETMAKQGNAGAMYEEGAINSKQVRTWKEQRSMPGAMLPVAQGGLEKIKEIQGVDVPSTVFNMIEYYLNMLQKIPGQFDSANGQASSNVTSGEQAKALISAASTRLNSVTDAIQEALEETFGQYVELIAQFYTTERVARVTGRKVGMSRDRLVNSVDTQLQNQLDNGEVEKLDLQEEYVPMFDIKVNIAADKPVDREYWVQMAFNMLKMLDPITQLPMIDAEAVRYTVQYGRMEPMNVIQQRIQEAAQVQQQQQEAMMQAQQLQQENQGLQQQLQQVNDQQAQTQQQDKQFEQSIQQQKIDIEAAKAAAALTKQSA